jgi:hypothetical protein
MNTTKLKPFAQQARKILMEGVRLRMLFWGFDGKSHDAPEPEAIPGGVIFRNEVYSDAGLPGKWQQMKVRINSHTFHDAIEEAAYTWFNRLMAIKILEKNGYEDNQLGYEGTVPALLVKARNGIMPFLAENEKQKVREHLLNGDEETAFGLLLIAYCRRHPLLNRVFGGIDDFTELLLPHNLLTKGGIIELLNVNGFVQEDDYRQVELIGWLYQFYISEKKDEVFKGFKENKKARKEDIPAATQIFTPKWIVKYLVENTVGKTWLDLHPDSEVKTQLKYMVENDSAKPAPLEGIDEAGKITLLDPAAGSGHILVTAFDLYMLMYKEEGSTTRQAVREILKHNLFGLDIDKRAAQLARFAVLMKAAGYDQGVLNENILPHIYSMPEPKHFNKEHLEKFLYEAYEGPALDRDGILKDLNKGLLLMRQAQNLGSIIQFDLQDDTRRQLKLRYQYWCDKEEKGQLTLDELSWWKPLAEYLNPLCVLLEKYTCVAANPPYMGQKSMNGELKDYVGKYYPTTKGDLMTVFMEVIPNLAVSSGRFALINLPSWLFLSSFEEIRSHYLQNYLFESLLHMGRGIFGIDFGSVAFAIKKVLPGKCSGNYFRLHERNFQHIYYEDIEKLFLYCANNSDYTYDFNLYRDDEGASEIPEHGSNDGLKLSYPKIEQTRFLKIPGSPIAYWVSEEMIKVFNQKYVQDYAHSFQGIITGDNNSLLRLWFEIDKRNLSFNFQRFEDSYQKVCWVPYQKGGDFRRWYGNSEYVLRWNGDGSNLVRSRSENKNYYFKSGITWSFLSSNKISARLMDPGFLWDVAGSSLFPNSKEHEKPLLGLLNSKVGQTILNIINPTLNYQVENILAVPVLETIFNENLENLVEKAVSISKEDWNSREVSWDFAKSPLLSGHSVEESVSSWRSNVSATFFKIYEIELLLNKEFIIHFGLEKELDPVIPLDQISILQEELEYNDLSKLQANGNELLPVKKDALIQQFISYSIGLLMGRYRLDTPGLNIAHPEPTNGELAPYTHNGHHFVIDDDAIIPLFGEDSPFADNVVRRFKDVLVAVWGEDTLTENINFLNECLGMSYEKFLIEKFWDYHKKVYQKKPIYWLFSSPGGSFKILVYMHRMDKFTVQKIRLNYLHKYTEYLGSELEKIKANGATNRTVDKLEKAIQDCREYDKILKPLADQQIVFDLDDGVTVNHAKFKPAVVPIK